MIAAFFICVVSFTNELHNFSCCSFDGLMVFKDDATYNVFSAHYMHFYQIILLLLSAESSGASSLMIYSLMANRAP